jgi:hypothetical protein
MNAEMPCLPFEGSVTAMITYVEPTDPCVMNVLLPLRIQSLPSRLAVVFMLPESLPEPGSVNPHAPNLRPEARSGTYFFFCSSLPNFMMCPVHRLLCEAMVRATDGSTFATSSMMMMASISVSPAPPSSSGHVMPMKPSWEAFWMISKGNSCDSSYFMT